VTTARERWSSTPIPKPAVAQRLREGIRMCVHAHTATQQRLKQKGKHDTAQSVRDALMADGGCRLRVARAEARAPRAVVVSSISLSHSPCHVRGVGIDPITSDILI